MIYVQFKEINAIGKEWDALGSDGVFILDGRNRLDVMITDAKTRLQSMCNVRKFTGFDIIKGERISDPNYKVLWSYSN